MATPASPLQLAANRANSQLSTGPRTEEGRLASSANARSHGLTTRHPLLPSEDPAEFERHHQTYLDHYKPKSTLDQDAVVELANLRWRLRRVPLFEADLLNVEVHNLTTNPDLKPVIENLGSSEQIPALAFARLVERRILPNLHQQEARLARRADKIQSRLELSTSQQHPLPIPLPVPAPAPQPKILIDLQEEIRKIEAKYTPRPIHVAPKAGRNEPCPCGSGLKFKRCCLDKPVVVEPQ